MQLRNSAHTYGWVSIVLHWLVAVAVFALFGLGLWMMDLGYYDPWRQTAPFLHKSIGVALFALMLARLLWRWSNPRVAPVPNHDAKTQWAARLGHGALYLGLFALMISGYLISTADGRGIEFFGLFSVPAVLSGLPRQEDIAGAVHLYLAWGLVCLALVHALAALKHHLIDRDSTLLRMLGRKQP